MSLLADKRGLIVGVANDRSIAWGIAQTLSIAGAELAFTYQGDSVERRVRPLAESLNSKIIVPCDAEDASSVDNVFAQIEKSWGSFDFLVHSIAFSDKNELKGRYVDTSPENFARTMRISCFSFTDMARRAKPLMSNGGSLITLSYYGAERVMPSYNVMGVAKAALEASVRYLAADLGPDRIRVNAISAGPMRTLSGSAVGAARRIYAWSEANAPLRTSVTLEQLGNTALYFVSDMSGGVTGEVHHVDAGYNIVGLPYLTGDEAE